MKSETALIRTYSRVELNPVAAVDLNLSVVVNPGDTELNESFGLNYTVDNARLDYIGALFNDRLEGFEDLADSLKKFGLIGITLANGVIDTLKILAFEFHKYIFLSVKFDSDTFYHITLINARKTWRNFKN